MKIQRYDRHRKMRHRNGPEGPTSSLVCVIRGRSGTLLSIMQRKVRQEKGNSLREYRTLERQSRRRLTSSSGARAGETAMIVMREYEREVAGWWSVWGSPTPSLLKRKDPSLDRCHTSSPGHNPRPEKLAQTLYLWERTIESAGCLSSCIARMVCGEDMSRGVVPEVIPAR